MGVILSRFKSKESSREKLERIDDEIRKLEDHKFTAIRRQKNLVGLLFIVSGLIYIVGTFIFYFFYLPTSIKWRQKFINALPLIIFPLIVYLLKRCVQWYYVWIIEVKEDKLRALRNDKRKILANVMETETYKVAKELLEKYEPSTLRDSRPNSSPSSPVASQNRSGYVDTARTRVRYRGSMPPMQFSNPVQPNASFNFSGAQTPERTRFPLSAEASLSSSNISNALVPSPRLVRPVVPSMQRFARPIINPDRSVVEKLVDYVVGDGPNNRYALICSSCHCHNGMALKEEFEYIAFRCCYCSNLNLPRKTKPAAPNIDDTRRTNNLPLVEEPESDNDSRDGTINSLKFTEVQDATEEIDSTIRSPCEEVSSTEEKDLDKKSKVTTESNQLQKLIEDITTYDQSQIKDVFLSKTNFSDNGDSVPSTDTEKKEAESSTLPFIDDEEKIS